MTQNPFPTPSSTAIKHSMALIEQVIDRINQDQGYLSFYDYMNMALYEPGLGYYVAGSHKIGPQGDFITAPEVSPLFGQCIGNFCRNHLSQLSDKVIFELGAGSGALCISLMKALQAKNALPKSYWILEPSPDLQQRQRTKIKTEIPELYKCITWLQQLPEVPFEGIIIANEVLDALPIHRFKIDKKGIYEQGIGFNGHRFYWQDAPQANKDLQEAVSHLHQTIGSSWTFPYVSEIDLSMSAWLESVSRALSKGLLLFIDYGYEASEFYHPQRNQGTLMCHYQHQAHSDPFMYPGLQDITAHVNFTHLAESAKNLGLDVLSYTNQAQFLLDNGLAEHIEDPLKTQQLKWLTHPNHFGEIFKAMVLSKK